MHSRQAMRHGLSRFLVGISKQACRHYSPLSEDYQHRAANHDERPYEFFHYSLLMEYLVPQGYVGFVCPAKYSFACPAMLWFGMQIYEIKSI